MICWVPLCTAVVRVEAGAAVLVLVGRLRPTTPAEPRRLWRPPRLGGVPLLLYRW